MGSRSAAGQLPLAIEPPLEGASLPVIQPRRPMVGDAPFDDEEWFFEPWWPGAQALVHVERGQLRLAVEHLADAHAAFDELRGLAGQFGEEPLVVEGTLLVLDDEGRPDADLLRQRLERADTNLGSAALVCSDLLHRGDRSLLGTPFAERRAILSRQLSDGDQIVLSRGYRGEGTTLAEAVAQMGINAISARRLTARYRPGVVDEGWLRLPVTETPAPETRPLLALLQRLPL